MPSSTIIHVAVFSVGAALGAGIAAGVASRRKESVATSVLSTNSPVSAPMQVQGPLVQTSKTGARGIMQLSPTVTTDILRYGNPGEFGG
jgi:endonuclease G